MRVVVDDVAAALTMCIGVHVVFLIRELILGFLLTF